MDGKLKKEVGRRYAHAHPRLKRKEKDGLRGHAANVAHIS
jgi:hypothetical protein